MGAARSESAGSHRAGWAGQTSGGEDLGPRGRLQAPLAGGEEKADATSFWVPFCRVYLEPTPRFPR